MLVHHNVGSQLFAVTISIHAARNGSSNFNFTLPRRITLSFKTAMLYATEPDRQLACPVEGLRVKHVADTWHAPRSGGRLHEGQDIFAKRGTAVRSATEG